jgi:hypothetical protein
MLTVSSGDVIPQLPTKEIMSAGKNLMLMTLLENYDGKHIEMVSRIIRGDNWMAINLFTNKIYRSSHVHQKLNASDGCKQHNLQRLIIQMKLYTSTGIVHKSL